MGVTRMSAPASGIQVIPALSIASGRPPRHRDCRVAIAPRNDSCYGLSLRAQRGNLAARDQRPLAPPPQRPFAQASGLPRRYRASQ